jgi:hypothetical protein
MARRGRMAGSLDADALVAVTSLTGKADMRTTHSRQVRSVARSDSFHMQVEKLAGSCDLTDGRVKRPHARMHRMQRL